MSVASLSAFQRRFVRARGEPGSPDYVREDDDTESMAMVCAMEGLDNHELVCAACGSAQPRHPCVVRSGRTGHMFGFALCKPCDASWETAHSKVDAALAGQEGV